MLSRVRSVDTGQLPPLGVHPDAPGGMRCVEPCFHQNVEEAIAGGDERGTELIFRTLRNTARAASNASGMVVAQTVGA